MNIIHWIKQLLKLWMHLNSQLDVKLLFFKLATVCLNCVQLLVHPLDLHRLTLELLACLVESCISISPSLFSTFPICPMEILIEAVLHIVVLFIQMISLPSIKIFSMLDYSASLLLSRTELLASAFDNRALSVGIVLQIWI